jgi:carbonic anhydrase
MENEMPIKFTHFRLILTIILTLSFLLIVGIAWGQSPNTPHWEYEGEAGPEEWGEIDPAFALCATGESQSPIDVSATTALNLVDIGFQYNPSALNIFNNGHTIQVNYDAGSSIVYNEQEYQLLQFHFHRPSEHSVNGQPADMEIHFVHQDANGALAVVGVLLMAGDTENSAYAPIFENLPEEPSTPEATDIMVNAWDLLPEAHTFYTYAGSLTTPPCTQGVRWLLLTEPITLSAEQIEEFASIFELNARPVQPLNERDLLQDNS